jgi:hypothetical protein
MPPLANETQDKTFEFLINSSSDLIKEIRIVAIKKILK